MPAPRYTLIRGEFYIRHPDLPRNGPEPDGDTINFLPDNDDLVRSLPRFSSEVRRDGLAAKVWTANFAVWASRGVGFRVGSSCTWLAGYIVAAVGGSSRTTNLRC